MARFSIGNIGDLVKCDDFIDLKLIFDVPESNLEFAQRNLIFDKWYTINEHVF